MLVLFIKYTKHVALWVFLWLLLFALTNTQTLTNIAFIRATGNIFLIAALSYLSRYFVLQYYEKTITKKWVIYGTLLCIGFSALRLLIELYVFKKSLFGPNYQNNIKINHAIYQGLFFLIISVIVFACSTFYQIAKERRRIENNLQQLQYKHVEAQLNYLRSQINPHFLFNTLHNIYSAVTLKKEVAGEMILKLSDLLHYVTYDGLQEKVLLQTELDKMKAYIELFQLKTPHPLNIEFTTTNVENEYTIEPVLLLPFIENALKHGNLTSKKENGFLLINCTVNNGQLSLQINNSYNANNTQKDRVGGVGLENIKSRLLLLYPNNHNISINDNQEVYSLMLHLNLYYAKPA